MTRFRTVLVAALIALSVSCAAASAQDAPPPAPGPAAGPAAGARAASSSLVYTGRVVDEAGHPVAGATAFADSGGSYQVMRTETEIPWRRCVPDPLASAATGPFARRARASTGADGRFAVADVPPPAGGGWVRIAHPEFVAGTKSAKGVAVREGTVDVGDVVLQRGATLQVRALLRDGAPAAGAWVVAKPASETGAQTSWAGGEEPGDVKVARAGADGACVVRGLRRETYRVAAFTDATLPAERSAEPGSSSDVLTLRLEPGATLRVVVRTRGTEAPVAGARVTVDEFRADGGWSMPAPPAFAVVRTDAAGVAAVAGLPEAAEYSVVVVPPDFADDALHHPGAFHVSTTARAGATVTVGLDAPIAVALAVSDAATKAPVKGVRAVAHAVWDRYDRTGGDPVDVSAVHEGGAAVFRAIRAGPWTFDVWAAGYVPQRVGPIDVPLSPQGLPDGVRLVPAVARASGRVVERGTGRPVVGAAVESYEWIQQLGDGQRAATTTDADGRFVLAGLLGRGSPLQVTVRSAAHRVLVRDWTGDLRTESLGELEVAHAATIRGRLTDAAGRPLVSAAVELDDLALSGRGKGDTLLATTDADGRYEFAGLVPGRYAILGGAKPVEVEIGEGDTVVRDLAR